MERRKNSAIIVNDRSTRFCMSCIDVEEGYVVEVDGVEEVFYFADKRYYLEVEKMLDKNQAKAKVFNGWSSIKDFLLEQGVNTVYINFSTYTHKEYLEICQLGFEVLDGQSILDQMRSVKDQDEIDRIKKACKITQEAVLNAFNCLRENVTEEEIAYNIKSDMYIRGGKELAFSTIVAFGKNTAVPHHVSDKTMLKKNQPILIDCGCKYGCYCADITRVAYYGEPTQEFIETYQKVVEAGNIAQKNIKIGDSGRDADGYAREYLTQNGLGENFTHSLGHGVGLDIHESPYLSPKSEERLMENQTFTVEPGVYFDGKYGIRVEDTVLLTKNGVQRLFDDDKKLIVCYEGKNQFGKKAVLTKKLEIK